MKLTNIGAIKEKVKVYNAVSKLCSKIFKNYHKRYDNLSDVEKDKLDQKFNALNFKLKD